jgi:predicted phage terminase large subunit-like protein
MDKERRLKVVSPFFENGQVYFEKHFEDLRDELIQFPAGLHEDRVDSLSQSLNFLKNAMYQVVRMETLKTESFIDMQF